MYCKNLFEFSGPHCKVGRFSTFSPTSPYVLAVLTLHIQKDNFQKNVFLILAHKDNIQYCTVGSSLKFVFKKNYVVQKCKNIYFKHCTNSYIKYKNNYPKPFLNNFLYLTQEGIFAKNLIWPPHLCFNFLCEKLEK